MTDRMDWSAAPKEVVDLFKPLLVRDRVLVASAPCEYGPGTWERTMIYRMRVTYDIKFLVNGEYTPLWNPLDDNLSRLGTPMEAKTARSLDRVGEDEFYDDDDDY